MKRRIVAQSRMPGVSVSQVARRYDINANLVFKWRCDPRFQAAADEDALASFLPVEVVSDPVPRPVADGAPGEMMSTNPTADSIRLARATRAAILIPNGRFKGTLQHGHH